MSKTPEQRFWEKVKIGKPDECWLWTAAIDTPGYGAFNHLGKKRNSHRLAYEFSFGPIDRNMDIKHSCDVRLCCNPRHLSPGTRLENVRESQLRNRNSRGESNGTAKLNEPMVRMIRELAKNGYTRKAIARLAGLNRETVRDVVNGSTWAHVNAYSDEVA